MNETEEEELLFFETFSHDNSEVSLSFNQRNIALHETIPLPSMRCTVLPFRPIPFRPMGYGQRVRPEVKCGLRTCGPAKG